MTFTVNHSLCNRQVHQRICRLDIRLYPLQDHSPIDVIAVQLFHGRCPLWVVEQTGGHPVSLDQEATHPTFGDGDNDEVHPGLQVHWSVGEELDVGTEDRVDKLVTATEYDAYCIVWFVERSTVTGTDNVSRL